MKRNLPRIMLAAMALAMSGVAMAQDATSTLRFKLINDTECKVIKPEKGHYAGDIVIPNEASGFADGKTRKVVEVDEGAFYDCKELTSIAFPGTMRVIGKEAFRFSGLSTLSIPANVDSIGYLAFDNMTKLTSLTIEDGTTPIKYHEYERYNFYTDSLRTLYCGRPMPNDRFRPSGAPKLHTITFGPAVTTIPNSFASGDTCLVKINWGGNEKYIGKNAFNACTHLPTVSMPESMKEIGQGAFYNCYDLASVNLGTGVKTIATEAFRFSGLRSLSIPANVDSIGYLAFDSMTKLTSLTFEDGTTPIKYHEYERYNFYTDSLRTLYCGRPMPNDRFRPSGAPKLHTISFGPAVTTIPNSFAYGDTCLTKINWGYNEKYIGKDAFSACTHLPTVSIPESVKEIGQGAFYNCYDLASVVLGNGVKTIATEAFRFSGLRSLSIPANVDSIGYLAFDNLYQLKDLRFENGTTPIKYHEYERYNFYTDSLRTLYCGRPMPNDRFRVGGAPKLRTITFGPAVTTIPNSFAYGDTCLVEINWGCHETYIGKNAFNACKHLPAVAMPSSMKEIGQGAFYDCYDLAEIYFNKNLKTIATEAFRFNYAARNLVIPASVDSIGYLAFDQMKALENLRFEDGNTPIKYHEYERYNFYTDSLRTLYCGRPMPNDRFRVGGAPKLRTISFGPAVTTIPNSFAYGDTCLVKIYWGGNETYIGKNAFNGCKHLPAVKTPESMKEIGQGAFYDCYDLADIRLNENLETIATEAFRFNYAVRNLSIPSTVDSIGYLAFDNMKALENLRFEDGNTPIRYHEYERYNFDTDSLRTLYCGRPMPNSRFRPTSSKKLWKVTFGPYVDAIPTGFASDTKSITTIECTGSVPPVVHNDAFFYEKNGYHIYDHATLYVNEDDLNTYKTANYWNAFFKVEIYDAIQAIESDKATDNGAMYNLQGQKVGEDYKGIVIRGGKKFLKR